MVSEDKKLKIVIVANTGWYIYNFRKNLIRALRDQGCEVYAVAPQDQYVQKLQQLGVEYHELKVSQRGKNPFAEFLACIKLWRILRYLKPDYVLTFTIKPNLYVGLCRHFLEFDQIANISGLGEVFEKKGIIQTIVCGLYKFALCGAQRVFLQNQEDLQTVLNKGLLPKEQCRRIPGSGVDLSLYRPDFSDLKDHPRRFLMFGRLVPKKGYDLFLKAAERIQEKLQNQAEFWIMGIEDNTRKESRQLYDRIKAFDRKRLITYLTPRDDVVHVLHQADVVVLPSQYNEGVPRSLLEAMACGKPVITTNWKGCRDTVDHGKNGYLIEPNNVDQLCHCIKKYIEMSDTALLKMGRHSRIKAQTQFDENVILQNYFNEVSSYSHNDTYVVNPALAESCNTSEFVASSH